MTYDNTNSGALFKNHKDGVETRPDYTGNIDVEGKEYRLAAWVREGKKNGRPYMSLKVSEKESSQPGEDRVTGNNSGDVTGNGRGDLDSEIPF